MDTTHTPSITLYGAGRMGSALAGGWLSSETPPALNIIDPYISAQVQAWADAGRVTLGPGDPPDILVLAVKPQMFQALSGEMAKLIGPDTQVLSIMAGITLDGLSKALGTDRVARAMPNTPGLIGKGVTILCLPNSAPADTEANLRALLAPLGDVEGPLDETLLSAATALSGSGPAYGFLLAEVMAAAGMAQGLEPCMAMRLARKTVEGAGALMEASSEDAATLRQNVTSPNGVTQAALEVLMEEEAMPALFREAIRAGMLRDQALAKEGS